MIDLSAHQSALPNLRDIGHIPIASPSSPTPLQTRPGVLYRAAAPTPNAVASLQALSITDVFDLRSDVEINRQGGPAPAPAPPGLARHHVPVFQSTDYTPGAIALRFRDYAAPDTTAGFVSAYRGILRAGAERAFGPILRHLARRRDNDQNDDQDDQDNDHFPSPCLVHCTTGKDRTGLLCAIVLSLCGVDDRAVACEYGLTDEGLASLKPAMVRGLMAAPGVALDEEGALRMLSSRPESMLATLEAIRQEYGSVEEYVLNQCKLSPRELEQIRKNLIVEAPPTTSGDTSRPAL